MKTITFTKELIPLIQSGQKTQTRRKISYTGKTAGFITGLKASNPIHRYKKGDICIIKNSRFKPETFGFIEILNVSLTPIGFISEDDAKAEGFNSTGEFLTAWASINIGLRNTFLPETNVWKIEFKYIGASL